MDKQTKTRTAEEHVVSLKRPDGYYSVDNEMVENFAAKIGIYAFGVYHLLKQRSFMKNPAIGQRGMSVMLAISTDSVRAAVQTLIRFGLVEERRSAAGGPPRYDVVHAKDALTARREDTREAQEDVGGPPRPEIRTRVKTVRVRNSGQRVSVIQDDGVKNSGQERPEFRTLYKEEVRERREEDILIREPHVLRTGNDRADSPRQDVSNTDMEAIYRAYPRHVGRPEAFRAIRAAVRILRTGVAGPPPLGRPAMTAAEAAAFLERKAMAFRRSPAGCAGRFTPHPATWLNQGRYLDDESEWHNAGNSGDQGSAGNRGQQRQDGALEALRRADAADAEDADSALAGDFGHRPAGGDGGRRSGVVLEGA